METPLCSICLENDDILCNGCRSKLDDGELTQVDVDLSRLLHDLSDTIGTLEDVTVKETIQTANAVVVLTAEGDGPKVVGRNGRVVKKIADEFDKSIRVVEDTGEVEEVVDKLLSPVDYEGLRTVYKPDGEERKVTVDEDYEPRVPFTQEEFRDLVEELTGERVVLSYE
ncbi:MAG: hypothetical protein SVU88_01985 [Candidatus Nanohaloarchaea archaeon]|nr:hypothetical protein [Candidatus Nanohaloarchaea archaeon]